MTAPDATPPHATPLQLGYRWPAEWERHRATWLVWPHNVETWPGRFEEAREQFAGFVATVARFEPVELLAVDAARRQAAARLSGLPQIHWRDIPTNDSWIRDHGPIFLLGPDGDEPLLLNWKYNAWGNKYPPFDLDDLVPRRIAAITGHRCIDIPIVLEGGSVEGNGQRVVMTTDRCLLNPNRNPALNQEQIEGYLREYLCAEHIIWLTGEIAGDDTDSHIDQIARFVNADTVVLVDVPGSAMFRENRARLERWSRATGRALEILRLPAPTARQVAGMWLPASYANFYLVNRAVLVPAFADAEDEAAADVLARCFPDREVVLVPSDDLVFGLGALHCLSQQEPAVSGPDA